MQFSKITLTGYKNYRASAFDFSKRIVGICGLNGKGKTNLLDAINYLCFTKSYFSNSDVINVNFGEAGFRLEGQLSLDGVNTKKIHCIYRASAKKEFFLDDVAYEKFSHHIGKFPCVVIAPDDVEMITGTSDGRRKFIDTLISQLDAEYLRQLILYNKVLAQRNSFLKNIPPSGVFDSGLLHVLDMQLAGPATYIFETRTRFLKLLFESVTAFYQRISEHQEVIALEYRSSLQEKDIRQLLKDSQKKDIALQRTTTGIHRDDILFLLKQHPFKNIASQGQRKSLLFACKLAEYEILRQEKGFYPVLLLDDIFEKLDDTRMSNLLEFVCKTNEGQVFITDTNAERLKNNLLQFTDDVQIIELA